MANKPAKNTAPAAAPAPKANEDRFAEVRKAYPTAEEFRESIKSENEATLRNSAKEFEINLRGRDNLEDIRETIVEAIYGTGKPDESDKSGADEGVKTPAHDPKTDEENAKAQAKTSEKDVKKQEAKNAKAMDGTTESAAGVEGAENGDVIHSDGPANPNEEWTEPNAEKRKTLSAAALDAQARGEKLKD